MPRIGQPHFWITSSCILALTVVGVACAQSDSPEFFPGDIFELRPPHVRISLLSETADSPRSYRSFPFFEAPPAIPPQNEVRLTDQDSLTLVYPTTAGSFSSGGTSLSDRLRIHGQDLDLDLFHISVPSFGSAVIPASESGQLVGRLSAGEYTVYVRNWYLPYDVLPDFDPEAFEPPMSFITPTTEIFAIPISGSDPTVMSQTSFQFTVVAAPEPGSIVLAFFLLGIVGGIRCRTDRRCVYSRT